MKCIAFREALINGSVVYTPCSQKVRDHGRKGSGGERFCPTHERAYRELVLAIVMNGGGRKH
jgi:hypothetical protein